LPVIYPHEMYVDTGALRAYAAVTGVCSGLSRLLFASETVSRDRDKATRRDNRFRSRHCRPYTYSVGEVAERLKAAVC